MKRIPWLSSFCRSNEGSARMLQSLPQEELTKFEDCAIFFDKVITKVFGNYYFTDCNLVQSKLFTRLNTNF